MADAVEEIDSATVTLAPPVGEPSVASYLQSLFRLFKPVSTRRPRAA